MRTNATPRLWLLTLSLALAACNSSPAPDEPATLDYRWSEPSVSTIPLDLETGGPALGQPHNGFATPSGQLHLLGSIGPVQGRGDQIAIAIDRPGDHPTPLAFIRPSIRYRNERAFVASHSHRLTFTVSTAKRPETVTLLPAADAPASGTTYSDPTLIQTADRLLVFVKADLTGNGIWHDLLCLASTDGGKTWNKPIPIARRLYSSGYPIPIPATTLDNHPIVFYHDAVGEQMVAATSTDSGASWTRETIDTEATSKRSVAVPLAVATTGKALYLAYELIDWQGQASYRLARRVGPQAGWTPVGPIAAKTTQVNRISHQVMLRAAANNRLALVRSRLNSGPEARRTAIQAELHTSLDGGNSWKQQTVDDEKGHVQLFAMIDFIGKEANTLRLAYARIGSDADQIEIVSRTLGLPPKAAEGQADPRALPSSSMAE